MKRLFKKYFKAIKKELIEKMEQKRKIAIANENDENDLQKQSVNLRERKSIKSGMNTAWSNTLEKV